MSIKAIVYTSNTGHTEQYARLLGKKTSLPVYSLQDALKQFPSKTEVIYLGWLMAGGVKDYPKAVKHFAVKALGCIGMSKSENQIAEVKIRYALGDDVFLFYLQGGFEFEKLHGLYKFMMLTMKCILEKKLSKKENKTPEDEEALSLLSKGGNAVAEDNLSKVFEWYQSLK